MNEIRKEDSTEWNEMDFSFLRDRLFEIGFIFRGTYIDEVMQSEYAMKYHEGLLWITIQLFPDDNWILRLRVYPQGIKKDFSSERFTCRKDMTIARDTLNQWIINSKEWNAPLKLKV